MKQPRQPKVGSKVEVLQFPEYHAGWTAEGVGDNRNADSLDDEFHQGVQSLCFLDDTHRETGCDTFFGDGINAFRPELPRELNKRFSSQIAEEQLALTR